MKTRLDLALIERGFFANRKEAQAAIMDGAVLVNGQKVTKSGITVSDTDEISLIPSFTKQKYVSRGGLKLEKALETFVLDVKDRICLDIGASTGGFTDCLLKSGVAKVYAIDVGYGQLDWGLRNDARVVVKERINARYLTASELYPEGECRANLAVIDCSFISLSKILPAVKELLTPSGYEIITLVKPQFEAGKGSVKKGVVKDKRVHLSVLAEVAEFARSIDISVVDATYSPLKGPKGNIEFLLHLKPNDSNSLCDGAYRQIVENALAELNSKEDDGEND